VVLNATNSNSRPYDFADIDNDGDIDIVNSEETSGNIVVWLNDGSENFTVGATIDPPGGSSGTNVGSFVVHIADFTRDGKLDILAISSSQERVDLFVGDGTGLNYTHQVGGNIFRQSGNLAGSDSPADIDGDGDLDIILANNFNSQPTSPQVLINDGTGRFKRTDYPMLDFAGHIVATQLTNIDVARGAMFGDYNRDGVMDFSYMTSNGSGGYDFNGVGVRLGTRPGEFGATRAIGGIADNSNPAFPDAEVHAADFDGDGRIDLLSLPYARMSLGNGDGTFQTSFPATSISAGFDNGVVADFNLDGIPDYVATRANRLSCRRSRAMAQETFQLPTNRLPSMMQCSATLTSIIQKCWSQATSTAMDTWTLFRSVASVSLSTSVMATGRSHPSITIQSSESTVSIRNRVSWSILTKTITWISCNTDSTRRSQFVWAKGMEPLPNPNESGHMDGVTFSLLRISTAMVTWIWLL
jgi:hypothetical protein